MSMSPQSGLAHNNRVGDFDPYALLVLQEQTGKSTPNCWLICPSGAGCWG